MSKKEKGKRQELLHRAQSVVLAFVFVLCGLWYVFQDQPEKGEIEFSTFAVSESGEMKAGESKSFEEKAVEPRIGEETTNLVNLNTASPEELDTLPSIGPATAKLIVEYREQYGGFASIEEIQNVKRIGEKTFEKLKDKICV